MRKRGALALAVNRRIKSFRRGKSHSLRSSPKAILPCRTWYHHDHTIGPQEGGDQRVLRLGPVARNHDWIGSYSVVVRNENGSRRSRPARLVVADPPQIRRQPVSSAVAAGRTVHLSVLTQFDGFPKSYQWYFNNRPIDGATHRVLWLRRIQPEIAGTYQVVVQNFGGTTTSDIAVVQIE